MDNSSKILALDGVIQPYAWGGSSFLADLTYKSQPPGEPWAEWWLGAHPKGPAQTALGTLDEVIGDRPAEVLSKNIADHFGGRLPFLLKVLDVQDMLSIQVHPTIAMAREGFAREETAGIDRMAPNRNYRDKNHKPELAVALSEFYLLHGFKSSEEIGASLDREPAWSDLKAIFEKSGLNGLYDRVMSAPSDELARWLMPLKERLDSKAEAPMSHPDYWARRAFERYGFDRGIFSIYWFNLVKLEVGEGIFQAAQIPHAYLSGACVELMANSDNVLRGGLTPKHIDPPELMKTLDFSTVRPSILSGESLEGGWLVYPTPAPDFQLWRGEFQKGQGVELPQGPAILFVYSGHIKLSKRQSVDREDDLDFRRGQACWLSYDHGAEIQILSDAEVYLAGVF
ncbi:MAG: mannose-6-phosphate isomerase, class I [Bacteroidota bacterium]